MKTITMTLLVALTFLGASLETQAAKNECGKNAALAGVGYVLSASGGDDTETIQCALDSAVKQNLPSVLLENGDYAISSIAVTGFEGVFSGTSRAGTRLSIADNQGCGRDLDDSLDAITFYGGNVTVKSMSIEAYRPCTSDDRDIFVALRFVQESCSKRTQFATVDRVDFIGPGTNSSEDNGSAVVMIGDSDCLADGKGPLGTFKLNRSTIDGFIHGARLALLGGAQVDINFNEITNTSQPIRIDNANQNTTITGNTLEYHYEGILVLTLEKTAPSANRIVVHKNTFKQTDAGGGYAAGVYVLNIEKRTNQSVVVTDNTFELVDLDNDQEQRGIIIQDLDGALISNNIFEGSADYGIAILRGDFEQEVSGTIIANNNFRQTNNYDFDIYLGAGTTNSIVGKQNATTVDKGDQNRRL